MAKQGIKPAVKAGIMFKVVLLALFFSHYISYVVSQIKNREDLRNFTGIVDVPFDYQVIWIFIQI
jgi:hypothetical protein